MSPGPDAQAPDWCGGPYGGDVDLVPEQGLLARGGVDLGDLQVDAGASVPEGNLAPEDCFLSRQILTHPCDDDVGFLEGFAERARRSLSPSSALFAASLRHKVRPGAVRGIFASMVDLSDHGDLMAKFLSLRCPRMFMYGAENSALSYLPSLAAGGVELAEIPQSGHWPMYANPVAMWERIDAIIRQAQAT
jgi:pimeloyl-ACP methyl ester carboxylesterase